MIASQQETKLTGQTKHFFITTFILKLTAKCSFQGIFILIQRHQEMKRHIGERINRRAITEIITYPNCGCQATPAMITSSNGNIFRVTGPLCGEFTGHRRIPLTKASGAELWCFFGLRLNKRLSKQPRRWWFETPSHPLWCHCNAIGLWIHSHYILQF